MIKRDKSETFIEVIFILGIKVISKINNVSVGRSLCLGIKSVLIFR